MSKPIETTTAIKVADQMIRFNLEQSLLSVNHAIGLESSKAEPEDYSYKMAKSLIETALQYFRKLDE